MLQQREHDWGAKVIDKLTDHIQEFLLVLERGFAFVGRQVHLEFEDEDYYIDMLFYHLKLRCYVVIELKACKFDPGFLGQRNPLKASVMDSELAVTRLTT